VLDADHTGLDDVKDRIVEELAVRKLRTARGDTAPTQPAAAAAPSSPSSARPASARPASASRRPGDGARFVRVALGGVRDEAEIRGHRRTYVGSQPGRIVRAITEAGTMNPVVLLDEVDKLSPATGAATPRPRCSRCSTRPRTTRSATTTSRSTSTCPRSCSSPRPTSADTIPGPLLDRMELVRLDGYTEDEKVFIAAPPAARQLERAGLHDDEVVVTDARCAHGRAGLHPRGRGARLERELGRSPARSRRRSPPATATPVTGGPRRRADLARPPKVHDEVAERTSVPGVATGLAVTGAGGDVLFVETTAFPPPGGAGLTLTGQLGDVMKESAQIALSYVRATPSSSASTGRARSGGSTCTSPRGRCPRTARRRASR
jgi:ATP-dependent Lon protease